MHSSANFFRVRSRKSGVLITLEDGQNERGKLGCMEGWQGEVGERL